MKVVQLIQKKQLRGAETFALQLSRELVKRGHQVKIVVLQDGEVELDFPDVDVLHINAKSLFDIKSFKKLATIIRNFKPDKFSPVMLEWKPTTRLAGGTYKVFIYNNGFKIGDDTIVLK